MSDEFKNYETEDSIEETQNNDYGYDYYQPTPEPVAEKVSSNLIPGLVGAFLGSLIGVVLWIIIYKLGFIAGIAGAITAVCAMKGYEMLGKALDKKGVICCILVAIIAIFLANRICWAWMILDEFVAQGYELTFFDVFPHTEETLTSEGLGYYFKDLAIGYVLTVLSSYKNIISAFKSTK